MMLQCRAPVGEGQGGKWHCGALKKERGRDDMVLGPWLGSRGLSLLSCS